MLLVVNVPPPNNGTSLQDTTVVSNGTTTKTQHCSGGYDGCFSGCLRSYNLESNAYTKCCGAHSLPLPCTLHCVANIPHSHRRASLRVRPCFLCGILEGAKWQCNS